MKHTSVLFLLVLVVGSGVSSPLLNLIPSKLITNILAPIVSIITPNSSNSVHANASITTNTSLPITNILNTVTNVVDTTLNTISSTLNNLTQAVTNLSKNLLQKLNVNVLASVQGSLNLDFVNSAIQTVAEQLEEQIDATLNATGTISPAILNVVNNAFNSISGNLTNIANITPENIQNAILNSVNQLKQDLTNVIKSGVPINSTSLQALVTKVETALLSLPDTVLETVNSIVPPVLQEAIADATDNAKNLIANYTISLINPTTLNNILNAAQNAVTSIPATLSHFVGTLDTESIQSAILKAAYQFQNSIKQIASNDSSIDSTVLQNLINSVQDVLALIPNTINTVINSVENIAPSVQNALFIASNQLQSGIDAIASGGAINVSTLKNVTCALQHALVSVVDSIGSEVNLENLYYTISNVQSQVQNDIANIIQNGGSINSSVIQQLNSTLRNALSTVANQLLPESLLNTLDTIANNLESAILEDLSLDNITSLIEFAQSQLNDVSYILSSDIISNNVLLSNVEILNSVLSNVSNVLQPIISPIVNEIENDIQNEISLLQSNVLNATYGLADILNIDPDSLNDLLNEIVNMIPFNVSELLSPDQITNLISSLSVNGSINLSIPLVSNVIQLLEPILFDSLGLVNNTINEASKVINQIQNTVSNTVTQIEEYKQELLNQLNSINLTECTNQLGPAINNLTNTAIENAASCLTTEINHYQNVLNAALALRTELSVAIEKNQISVSLFEKILQIAASTAIDVSVTPERFKICEGVAAVNTGISAGKIVAGMVSCLT